MDAYSTYSRGSEWRKWDLHIHTPLSIVQNYGGEAAWEKFLTALERLPPEVKVIGITDYYFIDGYEKVMETKLAGRLKNIDKVFPILEFRIDTFGSGNENHLQKINLHILFNVDESHLAKEVKKIRAEFISQVPLSKLDKHKTKMLSKENLASEANGDLSVGFSNFVPSTDRVFELINSTTWKDKVFLFLGYKEWSNLDKNQQLKPLKEDLYKKVTAFFASNIDTIEKSQTWLNELGTKPLLHSGDFHDFDKLDTANTGKDGKFLPSTRYKCATWIKSDPTFTGLQQIGYEPSERVRVQDGRPEEKAGYHVIDYIEMVEAGFWNSRVPLNQNLNSIIGGRSTGKSTLLKSIARSIAPIDSAEDAGFVEQHLAGVSVSWKDGVANTSRDIQYFPQNHMYEIAISREQTDKLVREIVVSKDETRILVSFETFQKSNRTEIIGRVNNLFLLQNDIDSKKEEIKQIGDKAGILREIETIAKTLNALQATGSLSTEELKVFEKLSKRLTEIKVAILQIGTDIGRLEQLRIINIVNSSVEYEFTALSDQTRARVQSILSEIQHEAQEKWGSMVVELSSEISASRQSLEAELVQITQDPAYIKGLAYQDSNKEYQELQQRLNEEQKKLAKILEIDKAMAVVIGQKSDLLKTIFNLHYSYLLRGTEVTKKLNLNHEGIEIRPILLFLERDLNDFFSSRLNQKGGERQRFISDFVGGYAKDVLGTVENYLLRALDGSIYYKGGYINENVTAELLSTNWFSISYQLVFQNDLFGDMSQGKRAFVILKLLLDFSDKKCPILIDQPEDSLDNRAIYRELVQYLRKKKKDRQIIIVTHNPNIVVGADSELVIVANQGGKDAVNTSDDKFEYVSGSLEFSREKDKKIASVLASQGIREHVCEILEGGTDAFRNREQRYDFKD